MKKILLLFVAVLLGMTAKAADTLLWEGNVTLDWKCDPTITASQCANFEEGADIVVEITCLKKDSWNSMKLMMPDWANFSWGDATNVPTTTTVKSYGPLTAEDVANMKSKGFGFSGHDISIQKVSYRPGSGPVDPTVLQKDPVTINEESGSIEFPYDVLVAHGATVGGGVEVQYTGIEGKNFYINFLHQGDADNQYTWNEFTMPQLVEEDGKTILALNKQTMDELNTFSKNLIIQVGFATVNLVKVVLPADMPELPNMESVELDKTELKLTIGNSEKLTATVSPATATVTWTSSDPAVATVDAEGNVTAVAEGTADITAAIEGASAVCKVTVTPQPSITAYWVNDYREKVYGDATDITEFADFGRTPRLIVETVPADARVSFTTTSDPEKSIKWYTYPSSKEAQASLQAPGKGTITISLTGYPGVELTASVEALDSDPTVTIDFYDHNRKDLNKLLVGNTIKLYAEVVPEKKADPYYDADGNFVWTVSDPEVLSIDETGSYNNAVCTLTAVKGGTVTLTATMTVEGLTTVVGTKEITVTNSGELTYTFDWNVPSRFDSYDWKTEYNFPSDATEINNFTFVGKNVDLTVSKGTPNPMVFSEGGTFEFKVSDPYVRIKKITASPPSSTPAYVQFGDKVTVDTGVAEGASWNPDPEDAETGVESVKFTCTKDVTSFIYWYVHMYRFAVPETLTLNKTEIKAEEGTTEQLTATVAPDDALPCTTEWSSADESIATVDANGLVTILKEGTTTITAKYDVLTAECTVVGMSGIENVLEDADNTDAPAEFFTLQGVRVPAEGLAPGVYIVRKGAKATKILVK